MTVPAGQTRRLGLFTVTAPTRQAAIDAANTLVTEGGFANQADVFLTTAERQTLVNYIFNTPASSLTLSPNSFSLPESAATASGVALSSIAIIDDGLGTNVLSLSGPDASYFEIVSNQLRLKAGVTLDFETKSIYSVRVNVDDTTVGGTPDAFADFTLNITDIADARS